MVLVRRQPKAHSDSGEIVVALVGDEATVKRLRMRDRLGDGTKVSAIDGVSGLRAQMRLG